MGGKKVVIGGKGEGRKGARPLMFQVYIFRREEGGVVGLGRIGDFWWGDGGGERRRRLRGGGLMDMLVGGGGENRWS